MKQVIKIIQKIIMILVGMPYLYIKSIVNLVNILDLFVINVAYNPKEFLYDYNNVLNKNISILKNAWKEIGSI